MTHITLPSLLKQIYGIGTDIIEIVRIKHAIERHQDRFINHLFTPNEQRYCQQYRDTAPRYAGRFAAKEAIVKAFGITVRPKMRWQEIEILNDGHGKPTVYLSQRLKQNFPNIQLLVSISHCRHYATATALLVGETHATL